MSNSKELLYYTDYLELDKVLDSQHPKSDLKTDEMLFIIIHQAYELWFKMVIHELDRVREIFDTDNVQDNAGEMSIARVTIQEAHKRGLGVIVGLPTTLREQYQTSLDNAAYVRGVTDYITDVVGSPAAPPVPPFGHLPWRRSCGPARVRRCPPRRGATDTGRRSS